MEGQMTKKYDSLKEKLKHLTEEELEHAELFLDALFTKEEKPYPHYFGRYLQISKEGDVFTMKLVKHTENTFGVAQGGAVFSLADIALGHYLIGLLGNEAKVFTQELKMNFIQAGKGEYLYAYPKVLHLGKRTAVTECEIENDKGALVAKAFGTFYLKRD